MCYEVLSSRNMCKKSFSTFISFFFFFRNQKSLKGVETRKKFVKCIHSCKNKTLLKLLPSNVLEIGSEFKGGLIFLGSFTVNHGDPWNFFLAITASCYRAKWIPRRVFRFLERVQRGKLGYLRRDTLSRPFRYVFSSPRIFPSFHSSISLLNFQGYIFFFKFFINTPARILFSDKENSYIPLKLLIRIKEWSKERGVLFA